MKLQRPLLIIDFEATCWDSKQNEPKPLAGRRYTSEIIEFGCALLTPEATAIEHSWQQYVQPTYHPELTKFCTELTGIEQATVDQSPTFPAALQAFRSHFELADPNQPGRPYQPYFASWGNYDRNALMDDCAKHGVPYPFAPDNHVNLKAEAKRVFGLRKRLGLSRMLDALGMEFQGRPHSGVDDACNIAKIAIEMSARGWKP